MASIDIKASRNTFALAFVVSAIAGPASSNLFGPGGGWEEMVKQQAVMSQEMSHIVMELRTIASNMKIEAEADAKQDTAFASILVRLSVVERELERLRNQKH